MEGWEAVPDPLGLAGMVARGCSGQGGGQVVMGKHWSELANTAHAEMLLLSCRIHGNSTLGRKGGQLTEKGFHYCLPWDWCRNTTSPSGIQGATNIVGGMEERGTEECECSGCLARHGGQERGLESPQPAAIPHSCWIELRAGPGRLSLCPEPVPAPSALAAHFPPSIRLSTVPLCPFALTLLQMCPDSTEGAQ